MKVSIRQPIPMAIHCRTAQGMERNVGNVVPLPTVRIVRVPVELPPGENGCHQPGKGPVTMFVAAATIVACLGFVGHLAGLL